jgi:digeranylgeranylglycerophospholipid reductase
MKNKGCDVLVVGGGAAGSTAARSSALKGANTLIIEKNSDTVKQACAEALTCSVIPFMPFKIPKTQLKWKIDGMKLYADGLSILRKGGLWEGYSIERKEFNPWITNQALEAGASILADTELIDLELNKDNQVIKAVAKKNGEEIEIVPKVVVAADGVNSTVANLLNLKKERKCSYAYITSYEISNVKLENPHLEQIFFDDFTPKGFAYIFPKSKNRANVGVGSILLKDKTEKFFEKFMDYDIVKKQLTGGEITTDRSGYAPVDYSLEKNVQGNVIFTGDVANQNIKPFIEGFLPGIICGDIAGLCAYNFLKNKAKLTDYEKRIMEKFSEIFYISDQILEFMIKIFEQENRKDYLLLLALCSDVIEFENFNDLFNLSYEELRDKIEKIISNKS